MYATHHTVDIHDMPSGMTIHWSSSISGSTTQRWYSICIYIPAHGGYSMYASTTRPPVVMLSTTSRVDTPPVMWITEYLYCGVHTVHPLWYVYTYIHRGV